MNSGKTTILLQTAYNYEERKMKVVVMKPTIDKKGEEYIVSRIGAKRKVDKLLNFNDNIYDIFKEKYSDSFCLLVDEVHFLNKKQIDQLLKIVTSYDIPVICYGLRTDFKTEGFDGSTRLLQIADKIEEIKTICECGRKATFNLRKINNKFVFDGEQVEIDGFDSVTYQSVCPKCLVKIVKQK